MPYGSVSVLTTATLIVPANTARRTVSVTNTSESEIIYLGSDADVTIATGFPLHPIQTRDQDRFPEGHLGDIYGITASTTVDARYWEVVR